MQERLCSGIGNYVPISITYSRRQSTVYKHTSRYKNYVLDNNFFEDDILNAECSFQDVGLRIILNIVLSRTEFSRNKLGDRQSNGKYK
jgi:hypothetical protein